MKKNVLILLFLSLLFSTKAFSQKYTISATGLPEQVEAQTVYLTILNKDMTEVTVLDSTTVYKGTFEFKDKYKLPPNIARIYISAESLGHKEISAFTDLVIERGDIKIVCEEDGSIVVTGTKGNDALNQCMEVVKQYVKLSQRDMYNIGREDDLTYEQIEHLDQLSREVQGLLHYLESYILSESDTRIGVRFFLDKENFFDSESKLRIIASLPQEYQSLKPLVQIKEEAESLLRSSVGMPYTDVEGTSITGTPIKLSDLLGNNEYTLLRVFGSTIKDYFKYYPDYDPDEDLKTIYADCAKRGVAYVLSFIAKIHKMMNPQLQIMLSLGRLFI